MSHIKTLKSTPTCFDHQLIIIRELICVYGVYGVERYAVCIPLHTRHHVKQMHVMLPHHHITTYEDSKFN
jgi:hypothetical protein